MHPSVPRFIRVVLVLATIASLLAFPLAASAAPKGKQLTINVTPLTTAVSANQRAAFGVFIHNDGNATLTHAIFDATVEGGTLASPDNGCTGGGASVTCDLDRLDAGQSVTLVFLANAPASAGAMKLNGTLTVDAAGGNPNAESKDVFKASGSVAVRNDDGFFGSWQVANQGLAGSTAGIGGNHHQTTSVSVPPVGFDYAAMLEELNGSVCGQAGIGKAVDLQFADGQTVSPFLTLTVVYDAQARGNRTPGNVGFVHQDDNGGCTFLTRGCHVAGCFNAWWTGHGAHKKLVVEARLASNGRGKGL